MAGAVVVPSPPATPRTLTLITACRDATGASLDDQPGGRWTHGFTYLPENYSPGQVRDVCDMDTVDSPSIPAPSGVTATPATTGGSLAAGVHGYRVSATRGGGETPASAEVTATTTGTTGTVALSWPAVYGATGYKVYGRTSGSELHLADVTTTSYTDTGAGSPSGALPGSNTTGGPGTYGNLSAVLYQPYIVEAEARCSAMGAGGFDFTGRALRQLEAVTPKRVEREFWQGDLARAKGYPNRYLTDGNAVDVTSTSGTPMTRQGGIEALEQALASCGYGPPGMIHTPAQLTLPFGYVRRAGNLILSNLDTVIVPGVGYPGTGPTGSNPPAGAVWAYATPMVQVRLDSPVLTPDPADGDWRYQALDRNRNDLVQRAQRLAAASFDGPCVFAALISLDT